MPVNQIGTLFIWDNVLFCGMFQPGLPQELAANG
jgi:hypothetical protein